MVQSAASDAPDEEAMHRSSTLPERFRVHFGRPAELAAQAPGRVNLIGEHTDYNGGLVLPCAIDRVTTVLAARRRDGRIRVLADDLGQQGEFDPSDLVRRDSWIDYVQAVVFALHERQLSVSGLDLMISSQVPREAGLSSSAALGVAVVTVIDASAGWGLDALTRARVVHRGESEFVGVGCGILDPFASALGQRDRVLRIDCRDQSVTPVPFPGEELRLLLTDSGVRRALSQAGSGYLERVSECRSALEAAVAAGVAPAHAETLSDLGPAQLPELERVLDPLLFRRARHVVLENQRVDRVCSELRQPPMDRDALGALMRAGQRSLRDDYEVSIPELDWLCEIADALPGVLGSRLTGAGFGGCVLHLVEARVADEVGAQISREFERRTGREAPVTIVAPSEGARVCAL